MTSWYTYDADVTRLRDAGMDAGEIAADLGIGRPTVISILTRLGSDHPSRFAKWATQEAEWAEVKAALYAECERLNMPAQVTLAKEAGFSRERARQILNSTRASRGAMDAARRIRPCGEATAAKMAAWLAQKSS